MRIADIYKEDGLPISFEIFPPKGELDMNTFSDTLDELAALSPDFISTTYSAGGSGNSQKTIDIAGTIQNQYGIRSMAHLTCINSDIDTVNDAIAQLKALGVENVLALRGDKGEHECKSAFEHACDLIAYLKPHGFCIGAACYPEGHVTCEDIDEDIRYLKLKQDMGADFFVSQLFFENESFYRFLDKARAAGVDRPIDAGIMPFLSKSQISRMVFMCGASLPSAIIKLLNKYEDSPEDLKKAGIEYAAKQILDLAAHGADGIHVYTMNQPRIARRQVQALKDAGYARIAH